MRKVLSELRKKLEKSQHFHNVSKLCGVWEKTISMNDEARAPENLLNGSIKHRSTRENARKKIFPGRALARLGLARARPPFIIMVQLLDPHRVRQKITVPGPPAPRTYSLHASTCFPGMYKHAHACKSMYKFVRGHTGSKKACFWRFRCRVIPLYPYAFY